MFLQDSFQRYTLKKHEKTSSMSSHVIFSLFLWVKSSELALKVLESHMHPVGMYSF